MANGQHQPIRFELNLAVGQNGAVFFCSRGDAPGYVERGRWPLEEKAQLQKAMPRAALELPPCGVGQNNKQRRIFRVTGKRCRLLRGVCGNRG
ncbi:MAG: hypothetical protein CMM00_09320 [Rhodopirellula sp.]|nr:hypothetical protein [Rhodopirellula sp.]